MSFSIAIDNAKVKELLSPAHGFVEKTVPSADGAVANFATYPSYGAGGISYTPAPLVTPGGKERLMALRRKIEVSGTSLISGDDLESEMHELRH